MFHQLILLKRRPCRVKEAAGVKVRIAKELECITVELVAAGFGYHTDESAAVVAIFSVRVAGENTELGNRVEIRKNPACSPMVSCTLTPLSVKPFADSR